MPGRMGCRMGYFRDSRIWRTVAMVWGLACFAPADLYAGSLIAPGNLDVIRKSTEPFGLSVSRLSAGGLLDKWNGLARKLEDDMVQLALCDGDREHCVSPAALRFLQIV